MREMARVETSTLEQRSSQTENELKLLLIPSGSQRRKERHPGNSRGHRRRRSLSVCGRDSAHVRALRRTAALEVLKFWTRRNQGSAAYKEAVVADRRRQGLFES